MMKIRTRTFLLLLTTLLLTLLATGCRSVDKYLQPDERLLSYSTYKVHMADSSNVPPEVYDALSDMKKYARQSPNSRLLGVGPRMSLFIYCLSNPDKDNFLHRYLRRKGQPPVVYDEEMSSQTCSQLSGLLNSKGCFSSRVSFDTIHHRHRDVKVVYHIYPTSRYSIYNVSFHAETQQVDSLLKAWRNESLIHAGDFYDQDILAKERVRLAEKLRTNGFFLASPDLISFTVDTAFEDNKLSIRLDVGNVRTQEGTRPLQRYHINDIFIYPDATALTSGNTPHFDTLVYPMQFRHANAKYKFLYNSPMTLKPQTISRSLMFYNGQTFRPGTIERTYNSLLNLRNFKYINIDLVEAPNSSDSNRLLNARIRLLNTKRQRLSLSIELNNSSPVSENSDKTINGNLGIETKVTHQNKNLFGGAEQLKTEWSLLLEMPKLLFGDNPGSIQEYAASFENGLNLALDLPTFLFPFTSNIVWQRTRPHTVFTLGTNYQMHSYFNRLLFNTGFGYSWQRRNNNHQLMPIELTYVRFFNIDSAFHQRMTQSGDARIKYRYSDHFIMNARYDYIFNTQQYGTRTNFNYLHLSLETAGNILNLVEKASNTSSDENGVMEVFGVPFSQYIRLNAELKRYFYVGRRSTVVARMLMGFGLPYGNSTAMPYERSFFGGGPTTLRAWHLRYLGPGTYQSSSENMFERIGDIQLVANLEYRFPLFSIIEGALFADMGNVWLAQESKDFPGGKFSFKELPHSIASDIGLGIRANISIVTIRCDLALPVYDPGFSQELRLRPPYWSFSQITANFGIDYPF